MAYISQADKAKIANQIKPLLMKYGVKGTLSIRNHSAIVLTLKSGKIDFFGNSNRVCANSGRMNDGWQPNTSGNASVNRYWFHEHYDGAAKAFLTEAYKALMSADWYDNSDAMTDYFNTAYYMYINIGKWDKPYIVE